MSDVGSAGPDAPSDPRGALDPNGALDGPSPDALAPGAPSPEAPRPDAPESGVTASDAPAPDALASEVPDADPSVAGVPAADPLAPAAPGPDPPPPAGPVFEPPSDPDRSTPEDDELAAACPPADAACEPKREAGEGIETVSGSRRGSSRRGSSAGGSGADPSADAPASAAEPGEDAAPGKGPCFRVGSSSWCPRSPGRSGVSVITHSPCWQSRTSWQARPRLAALPCNSPALPSEPQTAGGRLKP
jgi:hypothetical protein